MEFGGRMFLVHQIPARWDLGALFLGTEILKSIITKASTTKNVKSVTQRLENNCFISKT
jgi:hypothetical protein